MKNERSTNARRAAVFAARLWVAVILAAAIASRAQQIPIAGSMTGFNSMEYYEAPHQQQVKCRLSGAETEPVATTGQLLLIKQARIETFDVNGKLQLSAEAPECIYDPVNGICNSPGELHMQNGDGSLRTDGEGFLWRQSDSFLIISNQVKTVVEKTATFPQ